MATIIIRFPFALAIFKISRIGMQGTETSCCVQCNLNIMKIHKFGEMLILMDTCTLENG
jgi:hypothetical protein